MRLKTSSRSVDEKCKYDGKAEEKQSNSRKTTLTGTTVYILNKHTTQNYNFEYLISLNLIQLGKIKARLKTY